VSKDDPDPLVTPVVLLANKRHEHHLSWRLTVYSEAIH